MPRIDSSLEGFAVLPRRIRWTVTTSVPAEEVEAVRFFVDADERPRRRDVLWTDSDPPFAYGENGAQLGTWMGPGRHRFTAQVILADGSRVNETVVARVRETKTDQRVIEAGLYGLWRRLSAADLDVPPPPGKEPRFSADLWIAPDRTLRAGRTHEHVFGYEYWLRGKKLYVGTAWFLGSADEPGNYSGWLHFGTQCKPGDWPARYSWSYKRGRFLGRFNDEDVFARYLVLTADEEPCRLRRSTLEGVWQGFGI